MMRRILATLACMTLPFAALAQDCDPLPHNGVFCSAGGDWVRDSETPTNVTYTIPGIALSLDYSNFSPGNPMQLDELRQILNALTQKDYSSQTGKQLTYLLQDEEYIGDWQAKRSVYVMELGEKSLTMAESVVLREGWFVVVTTAQEGREFTEAHIAAHTDAIGRISLY
jgi:hypothetical protein